jgi:hypothetical protein
MTWATAKTRMMTTGEENDQDSEDDTEAKSDSEDGNNSSIDALNDSHDMLCDDDRPHDMPTVHPMWWISFPPLVLDSIARSTNFIGSDMPLF